MGLLQNGFRHNAIGRLFGGTNLDGANPSVHEYRGHLTGRMRNQFAGEGITDDLASVPNGARHPVAWVMARRNGGMASRNVTRMTLAPAGLAVGGVTANAPAAITFTVADADGQLISSGGGSASITFNTNTPLLTASLNAIGSANLAITASGPLGAEASSSGQAQLSFSMSATILPSNDTPPARTASASFSITGNLTPYAIGQMVGSTVDTSILTVDAIAAGVLAAALTAPIAANIRKVNDVTVTGTGTVGSEWGPA